MSGGKAVSASRAQAAGGWWILVSVALGLGLWVGLIRLIGSLL